RPGGVAGAAAMTRPSRRQVLAGVLATPFLSRVAFGQAGPRVVVIGGGFGGASVARALRVAAPTVAVTLVEADPTYIACPFSNSVIAGLRDIASQRFGYQAVAAAGVTMVHGRAAGIDPAVRRVAMADGTWLAYDR